MPRAAWSGGIGVDSDNNITVYVGGYPYFTKLAGTAGPKANMFTTYV